MGKIIVIEGSDGTGKSTQIKLLQKNLGENNKIYYHHFPTYNSLQGEFVTNYLKGDYPEIDSPYAINSFYAIDRVITYYKELKSHYDNDEILLFDRYTSSSMIYQSANYKTDEEKQKFADWVYNYEYNLLGLPIPDLTIYLDVDEDVHYNLLNNRTDNDGVKKDIHEKDFKYLRKTVDTGRLLSKHFDWNIIKVSNNNNLRSIENIQKDILELIKKI